jgi:hypothetical protein
MKLKSLVEFNIGEINDADEALLALYHLLLECPDAHILEIEVRAEEHAIYITDRHDVRHEKYLFFEGPTDVIVKHAQLGAAYDDSIRHDIFHVQAQNHVLRTIQVSAQAAQGIIDIFIKKWYGREVGEQGFIWAMGDNPRRFLQLDELDYETKRLKPGDIISSNYRNAWEILELLSPDTNRRPFQPGRNFRVKNLSSGTIEDVKPSAHVIKFREIK